MGYNSVSFCYLYMSLLVKSPDCDAEVKLADNIVNKLTTLLFNNFMYSIFINQHFRQQQYIKVTGSFSTPILCQYIYASFASKQ